MPLTRDAGNVYIVNTSAQRIPVDTRPNLETIFASTSAVTSGAATIISVDCTGAQFFGISNQGSINIYIEGSFDGSFFVPSCNVYRQIGGGSYSAVECVSASTIATFEGPYVTVRVKANSGSGVYRAALTYR